MPKTRIPVARRQSRSQRVKFKMAGRKAGKSGLNMTNDELMEIVNDKSAGKRRQKAAVILCRRDVPVVENAPVSLETE